MPPLSPPPGIWTPHRPHRPRWPTSVRSFIHDHASGHTSPLGRTVYAWKIKAGLLCCHLVKWLGRHWLPQTMTCCRSSQSYWNRYAWSSKLWTQLSPATVKFRPTTSFSSISESPELWRLKARRHNNCLIASDTFIGFRKTVTLSSSVDRVLCSLCACWVKFH